MSDFKHEKSQFIPVEFRWRNLKPARESGARTGVWRADLTRKPVQALMRLNQTSCYQWLYVKRAAETSPQLIYFK